MVHKYFCLFIYNISCLSNVVLIYCGPDKTDWDETYTDMTSLYLEKRQ